MSKSKEEEEEVDARKPTVDDVPANQLSPGTASKSEEGVVAASKPTVLALEPEVHHVPAEFPRKKRRTSPTKPVQSQVKRMDNTNATNTTVLKGNVAVLTLDKSDGKPGYIFDLKNAIIDKKHGTKDIGVIAAT